jgi:hypothetical protein
MDFDITGSPDGDLLLVTFSGRSTPDNAQAMVKRYFELVLGSGAKKILVDIRSLDGRLTAGETYFLVRDLPVKPIPQGIRTALLESEERHDFANFLETTAANAGVQLRCFFDRDAAVSWLRAP